MRQKEAITLRLYRKFKTTLMKERLQRYSRKQAEYGAEKTRLIDCRNQLASPERYCGYSMWSISYFYRWGNLF